MMTRARFQTLLLAIAVLVAGYSWWTGSWWWVEPTIQDRGDIDRPLADEAKPFTIRVPLTELEPAEPILADTLYPNDEQATEILERFPVSGCGIKPIKPIKPIGCKDLVARCSCDSTGQHCAWVWDCRP